MQKSYLIIGGNGFIGSHLIDALLEDNNKVKVFDIAHEKFRNPNPNVGYFISNNNSISDLFEAMIDVDIVFHLASASVPSTSNINYISDVENNLLFTLKILNIAVQQKIEKFIYFSSGGAVYGNPEILPIPENHKRNPISSYGILKSTIEDYLFLYEKNNGLQSLIIRPSNPYGSRQGHFAAQGVISTFLYNALKNQPLQIFGDGNSLKDYIYITDLINITKKLIKNEKTGVYNIGSGIGTSLNQIVDAINIETKRINKTIYSDFKSYDVSNFVLDMNKTNGAISNKITNTPLQLGISQTSEWIFNNRIKK